MANLVSFFVYCLMTGHQLNVTGRRWGLDRDVDSQPLRGTVEQHRGKRLAQTQTGGNLTRLHAFTSHTPVNSAEETIESSYVNVAGRQLDVFPTHRPRFSCLGNAETNSATITWHACVVACEPLQFCGSGDSPVLRLLRFVLTECFRPVCGAWYQLGHSFVHVTWRCVL
jgi:hypothetical protein